MHLRLSSSLRSPEEGEALNGLIRVAERVLKAVSRIRELRPDMRVQYLQLLILHDQTLHETSSSLKPILSGVTCSS